MRTLAHALVHSRFIERGDTTRIVVLPLPDTGLPRQLIEAGQPVPLDLLAGRPVNLRLDQEGLSADLCFAGPPIRCSFPWEGIIAVQGPADELVQTLVVTVATVMEDRTLRPTQADPSHPKGPSMELLDGEGQAGEPRPSPTRPKLKVINGEQS